MRILIVSNDLGPWTAYPTVSIAVSIDVARSRKNWVGSPLAPLIVCHYCGDAEPFAGRTRTPPEAPEPLLQQIDQCNGQTGNSRALSP